MDNTQTASLTAAKYYINHFEHFINPIASGNPEMTFFGVDPYDTTNGGLGDRHDFPSINAVTFAMAYTLIYDQLSGAERTAFAQKIFTDVDSHGYDSGCTNALQLQAGAMASNTSGTTAVTGSGFTGLTAGRQVYIRSATLSAGAGGWATIQSVNSDASLTLVTAPKYWSGGNAATVTNGLISEIKPYVAGSTCGFAWQVNMDHYVPQGRTTLYAQTTLVGSITAASTSMVVATTSGFPSAPFYLCINNGHNYVKVTHVAGTTLTIDRTAFGWQALSARNGSLVSYNAYLPNYANGSPTHNLVVTKLMGHVALADVLANESATARDYLDRAGTDWFSILAFNKEMWTPGFTQSGGSGYGPGRQVSYNATLATIFRLIGGSPSLDYSGGNWLRSTRTSCITACRLIRACLCHGAKRA